MCCHDCAGLGLMAYDTCRGKAEVGLRLKVASEGGIRELLGHGLGESNFVVC